MAERVNILGVGVSTAPPGEIATAVVDLAEGPASMPGPHYVCATSVHGLIEASEDEAFRRILNDAIFVAPDGMPLVWFGRLRGIDRMERVYGPDLTKLVCAKSAGRDISHFFYGGSPGVARRLAEVLSEEFPGLRVAGAYSPPFRPLTDTELREAAEMINDSGAHIVWVGLSTPKQERWIHAVRPLLRTQVLLAVGAAFDFHTGRVRQAPSWMQRSGLEWAFRLTQEPGRLWKRYAYNNPKFVYLVLRQILSGDSSNSESGDPRSDLS